MTTHREIMNHFFRDSEHQKVQSEIDKLGLKEQQEKIKSAGIDVKLNALEEFVDTKTEQNFTERFEAYKKAVLDAEAESIWAQAIDQAQKTLHGTVDRLKWVWSLEEAQDVVKQEAQKAGKQVVQKVGDVAAEQAKSWISSIFSWKFKGIEDFFKDFSISGIFKKIFSLLFGWTLAKLWFSKASAEEKKDPKAQKDTWDSPKKTPKIKEASNKVRESWSEIELSERMDKSRTAWYILLSKLSGLKYEKWSNDIAIMWDLRRLSILEINDILLNEQGSFKEKFWLTNEKYSDEDIGKVIIWIVWPFNREFLDYQLHPREVESILWNPPKYNERVKLLFTNQELQLISQSENKYKKLPLGIVSRLAILSIENFALSIRSLPGELSWKLNVFFSDIVNDEELDSLISLKSHSELYPKWVSIAFSTILTSRDSIALNHEQIIEKGASNWQTLSIDEKEIVKNIVDYKKAIIEQIWAYSLNLEWFDSEIQNNLTWWNIISLYSLSGWKTPNQLEWFWKVILYSWYEYLILNDL